MVKYHYNAWVKVSENITVQCEGLEVIHYPFNLKGWFYERDNYYDPFAEWLERYRKESKGNKKDKR